MSARGTVRSGALAGMTAADLVVLVLFLFLWLLGFVASTDHREGFESQDTVDARLTATTVDPTTETGDELTDSGEQRVYRFRQVYGGTCGGESTGEFRVSGGTIQYFDGTGTEARFLAEGELQRGGFFSFDLGAVAMDGQLTETAVTATGRGLADDSCPFEIEGERIE